MAFPNEHLTKIIGDYIVSTADTFDMGLETMVFPAEKGKKIEIVERIFSVQVMGADWEHPLDEYTRHYETVAQAKAGHKEICALVRAMMKEGKK